MVTSSYDGTVKIWNRNSKISIKTLNCSNCVTPVSFSNKGDLIAAGQNNSTFSIWEVKTGVKLQEIKLKANACKIKFTNKV